MVGQIYGRTEMQMEMKMVVYQESENWPELFRI